MMKFLRRTWGRYSKLGKGRKKKQTWRRPTGRDNKMRERRKGYPAVVSVGYQTDKKLKETINGKYPVTIFNMKDLEKIQKNQIAIVGSVGMKKKIEIVKKAKEMKISIHNVNIKKFLEKNVKTPQASAKEARVPLRGPEKTETKSVEKKK